MFDSEATAEELDTILAQVSVQSVFYRSLLVLLIDREAQTYDLAGARTRALELVKDTYSQMRAQATAAGFSEHFSITLAEMAIRASLSRDGGRDDVYLYMVKSVAKRGLHSITDAELAATNGHDVTDVVQGRYEYRVYANLTDAGVDLVQAQGAQLAAIAGVTGYKFAKPVARWRRDTMVVYCTTSAAADAVIAVLRGLQAGVPGPAVHFAADVPHFTRPAPNCRGVSSVRDPQAGAGGSFSERMADMIRLAIDAGVDSVDEAHPSIASYVVGIVDKLEGLWNDPGAMRGEPKP